MTAASFVNLLSICFGFVAGLYFCLGSAQLRVRHIEELSATYWDASPPLARFLITLKADYLCGGFLLCFTFVAQFLANAPHHFFDPSANLFANSYIATAAALLIAAALGGAFYGYRIWLLRSLHKQVSTAQIGQNS